MGDVPVFYRGIVVPPAEVDEATKRIREQGIPGDEGGAVLDLRPHLAALLEDPSLWKRERDLGVIKGGATFVCGDEGGATYYACDPTRNRGKTGIVIKLRAPLDRCFVDCRDFLCTAFQLWDAAGKHLKDEARARVARLFGDAVCKYFDCAAASSDQAVRIAMCNAAAHDPEVVAAHYRNRVCIGGRFGTKFRSAFVLRTPVAPEDVLDVYVGDSARIETPATTVDQLR